MLAPLGCSRSLVLLEGAGDSVPFMALARGPPRPSWVMAPWIAPEAKITTSDEPCVYNQGYRSVTAEAGNGFLVGIEHIALVLAELQHLCVAGPVGAELCSARRRRQRQRLHLGPPYGAFWLLSDEAQNL